MNKTCEKKLAGSQKECGTPALWEVFNINPKTNIAELMYVCDLHVTSVLDKKLNNKVKWIDNQN